MKPQLNHRRQPVIGHGTRQGGAILLKNLVAALLLAGFAYTAWQLFERGGGTALKHHKNIIVYTSGSCGLPCRDMVNAIRGEGEHVYVVNLDDDHEAQEELAGKLDAIGFDRKIYRLPVVDVFGEVFPDGPAIKKVLAAVRSGGA
jgi:hypothetical protein